MSSADPGGGPPDFNVLKENFNQQQVNKVNINYLKTNY